MRLGGAIASDMRMYDAFPENISASRGILFPVFIALAGKASSPTVANIARAQALLNAFSILLIYWAGTRLHSRACGLISALLFAVDPAQIRQVSFPMIESFYSFMVLSAACSVLWLLEKPSASRAVLCGLITGAGLLCRSALLFFPPVLALSLAAFKIKDARRLASLVILSAYLPLAPWALRNYFHFGALIPGELYTATGIMYTGAKNIDRGLSGNEINTLAEAEISGLNELSPRARDLALRGKIFHIATARPMAFFRGAARRLRLYIGLLSEQAGIPCVLLALSAVFLRPIDRSARFLGILAAYFLGIHSFMSVSARYLYPLAAVVFLLASAGLVKLRQNLLFISGRAEKTFRSAPAAGGVFYGAASFILFLCCCSYYVMALEVSGARPRSAVHFQESFFPVFSKALLRLSSDPGRSAADFTRLLDSGYAVSASLRSKLFSARGVAELAGGGLAPARADLRRAISISPGLYEAYLSLAYAEHKNGFPAGPDNIFMAGLTQAAATIDRGGEFTCEEAGLLRLMMSPERKKLFPELVKKLNFDYSDCRARPAAAAWKT
jgi:hypothetical protein